MKRTVRLIRQYQAADGSYKTAERSPELRAEFEPAEKKAQTRVYVSWNTCGVMTPYEFVAQTGLQHGRPRTMWRLHPDDVAAICKELNIRPKSRPLGQLKGRKQRLKPVKPDPRQQSMFDGGES